ncbi:M61 family metallopeptidase [Namhaeicola litoreus]|uniref:M61 family metallopeptidase n=1 Tax=Namhaeicola litoreus TaxID=1052145 RepID=A0ABW3Y1U2_9FLAO
MKISPFLFLFFLSFISFSQNQTRTKYQISFENAKHHEAHIQIEFDQITDSIFELRMSRTSPGRYAIHEFAKNVYDVFAFNENGDTLKIVRPNPHQWNILNPSKKILVHYKLFADRADGTFSQINEGHAHLNIPATFMFAPKRMSEPLKVDIVPRVDLKWQIATQLKPIAENLFFAPNVQYFMDSPIELSNFTKRSFEIDSNGKDYTINFILHHNGTEIETDTYFEQVKKIVAQEMLVFGELPNFDFNEYYFLACYLPYVSGDGMEHRNSTILTDIESLSEGGMKNNIGTVAHEFFHSWNVERIRPRSLEPFDFTDANMSGELWFAEGFTTYYTNLILCRAGIITDKQYVEGLARTFNYVWNSPGTDFFNPIEMSYQASFVDAATFLDPTSRHNTFISYYSYGSVLGLALDLSLRETFKEKNLDGFMALTYQKYGKKEIPYTITDLEETLCEYTNEDFGKSFFKHFIYDSKMPDYKTLFRSVGVNLSQDNSEKIFLGADLEWKNGKLILSSYPVKNSPFYNAGLTNGDILISINRKDVFKDFFDKYQFKPQDKLNIVFKRYGVRKETEIITASDPSYTTKLSDSSNEKILKNRKDWLGAK